MLASSVVWRKNINFFFCLSCLASGSGECRKRELQCEVWTNTKTTKDTGGVEAECMEKKTIEINICWVIILLMLVGFSFHDITVIKTYPLVSFSSCLMFHNLCRSFLALVFELSESVELKLYF